MDEKQKLSELLLKIMDFAYAIKADEKSESPFRIALTMSEEIMSFTDRALEIVHGEED